MRYTLSARLAAAVNKLFDGEAANRFFEEFKDLLSLPKDEERTSWDRLKSTKEDVETCLVDCFKGKKALENRL